MTTKKEPRSVGQITLYLGADEKYKLKMEALKRHSSVTALIKKYIEQLEEESSDKK